MPVPARDHTERQTWRDWLPDTDPADEVTIEELVESLPMMWGTKVTADMIRYWQKADVLPVPVKRWHNGATRAMYPREPALELIHDLLYLQQAGYTLNDIAGRLRLYLEGMDREDPIEARPAVQTIADHYEKATGIPATEIFVRITDAGGKTLAYSYSIPEDTASGRK